LLIAAERERKLFDSYYKLNNYRLVRVRPENRRSRGHASHKSFCDRFPGDSVANILTNARSAVAATRSALDAPKEKTTDTDLHYTIIFLGGVAAVGTIGLALWAASRSSGAMSAFAFGYMILGGASLVGGVLGLLFGIPKSVSDPASAGQPPTSGNASADGTAPGNGQRSAYTANTNLEQISDWLTKIIVGVALTEIASIRQQFVSSATYFGAGFVSPTATGTTAAEPVVAAIIMIYGLTGGFLAGYLLTRIFLQGAFDRVQSALRRENRALTAQIREVRQSTAEAGKMQGEIYTDLYRYKSEGFRDAIRKLDQLLTSPENQQNPALWVYLAAAHGQAFLSESGKRAEHDPERKRVLSNHRDAALSAVRRALGLGDDWKPVLQLMWDKNHPAKTIEKLGTDEDDLEVFYGDEDFKKLLGS
jgi:hypothetical protein